MSDDQIEKTDNSARPEDGNQPVVALQKPYAVRDDLEETE